MNSLKFYAIVLVVFPIYGIQSDFRTSQNGVSYYVDVQPKYDWYTAHVECSTRGMALVTVENKEENDDIIKLITPTTGDPVPFLWVGAVGQTDKSTWIQTERPVIPTITCYPPDCVASSDTVQNCVIIGNHNALSSVPCNDLHGFICEERKDDCCDNKQIIELNISQKAT